MLIQSMNGRLPQCRVIGKTEIVIGGKIQQIPPLYPDARGLRGIDPAQFAEQTFPANVIETFQQHCIQRSHANVSDDPTL